MKNFNLFNVIYERTHKQQLLKEETGSDLILLVQQLDAISLFIYCLNIVKFIKTIDISFFTVYQTLTHKFINKKS